MSRRPNAPSWIDRLVDWINRLPGPAALFYLVAYLATEVAMHVALWSDNVTATGGVNPQYLLNGVWVVLPPMWVHYLVGVANRALDDFAPALEGKPVEYASLRLRMLQMPARPVLLISVLAASAIGLGVAFDPTFVYEGLSRPVSYLLMTPVITFAYMTTAVVIFFTIRLLHSVTRAYDLVGEVDLIHQRPLFALSSLTMRSGLLWLLVVNLSIASIVFVEGEATGTRAIDYAFIGAGILVAFASFLLPLLGIHRRLVDARNRLIEENAEAVERARLKLYAALDKDDHSEVESIDQGLGSLFRLKDELQEIPTWPWRPGTLRTFLSAVALPILVWIAQRLLTRYF